MPTQFEGGLRVTDAAGLEVAAAVLRGVVNSELVAGLRDLGSTPSGCPASMAACSSPSAPDARARRQRGRAPARPHRRHPRRRPGAGRGAARPRRGGHRVQRQRRRRGGRHRRRPRGAPARAADRRRRRARRRRPKLDSLTVGRGRAPDRRPGSSPAAWCPRSGPRCPRSAGTAPRRSSPTRPRRTPSSARSTIRRFGTRITAARPAPARRAARWPRRPGAQAAAPARHPPARRSRPVGSQRELVDALTEQGFDVTQATVSRDIAELGLLKAPRADGLSTSTRRTSRRRGPAARVGRAPAPHPRRRAGHGRAQRPDPRPDRHAGYGQRRGPGHRRVDPHRAGRHAGGRQYAPRPVRRRARPRALARALRGPQPSDRSRRSSPR